MSKVEESVFDAILPIVRDLKYEIYDIEYLKEGTSWYLRIYIDKEDGISILDCETVSRAIDPLLDELNPIKTPYTLEVSSPGVERTLRKKEHFEKYIESEIEISLFKPVNGEKKVKGILKDFSDDFIKIKKEDIEINIDKKDISTVKTVYNF